MAHQDKKHQDKECSTCVNIGRTPLVEELAELCINHLPQWASLKISDVDAKPLKGGLTNKLYTVTAPIDPKIVLIRIFGAGTEDFFNAKQERAVARALAKNGTGPNVMWECATSRIEQYIPGKTLITSNLWDADTSNAIAHALGKLHLADFSELLDQFFPPLSPLKFSAPFSTSSTERELEKFNESKHGEKTNQQPSEKSQPQSSKKSSDSNKSPNTSPKPSRYPPVLFRNIREWFAKGKIELDNHAQSVEFVAESLKKRGLQPDLFDPAKEHDKWTKLKEIPWKREIRWLTEKARESRSPVVFCHNDCQEGNIIQDENGSLTLIDYEYSNYNYRGFDLGNHLDEVFINYGEAEWPFFRFHLDQVPNESYRTRFCRHYLGSYHGIKPEAVETADVETLDREISVFMLASHLMWSVWSLLQGARSQIVFGYLDYGLARMGHYQEMKKELIQQEGEGIRKTRKTLRQEQKKPNRNRNRNQTKKSNETNPQTKQDNGNLAKSVEKRKGGKVKLVYKLKENKNAAASSS